MNADAGLRPNSLTISLSELLPLPIIAPFITLDPSFIAFRLNGKTSSCALAQSDITAAHDHFDKLPEHTMNTIKSNLEIIVISMIALSLAAVQVSWVAQVVMA